jgi:hypothetical protein
VKKPLSSLSAVLSLRVKKFVIFIMLGLNVVFPALYSNERRSSGNSPTFSIKIGGE